MPAESEAQRRLFAIARQIQKGKKVKRASKAARRIARKTKPSVVRKFTHKRSS